MPAETDREMDAKRLARSRITNGSAILREADGRSIWVRRLRDLMNLHISDMGGPSNVSEAERSIIRRASTLTIQMEMMEERFAAGNESRELLMVYQTCANTARRLFESVGIRRRPRDVTPTLDQYIEQEPYE